ncbi:hypothetical protein QKU58_gp134 [Pyramimonas orientalis virus]|uniref:Uncharacterized protein n=1 Tax=Pyramimonas orientalis virus 01B TaxID=3134525 RepID=A0A7M3UNE8_9VIRU|nr:hypothetical protein QKU58_gp134 [Pyramimonas orientalis virus]QOI90197.1 hypothetical protein HWQ62_00060 [Pyramimonas orientalis virus]
MVTNNTLGDTTNAGFKNKIESFRDRLKKNTDSSKDLTGKVKSLTELNKNVSESYNVSLKIIVDVTKLLNQYMVYFNEIEKLMESFTTDQSNTLNNNYFSHINKITSEKIDELSSNFQNQLDNLKTIYTKNNIQTNDLDKYSNLLDNINAESKMLLQKQTGGKKVTRKYKKRVVVKSKTTI